eukprot:SAG31_NODE_2320_length_5943_cov_2.466975_2_plen_86_part_00
MNQSLTLLTPARAVLTLAAAVSQPLSFFPKRSREGVATWLRNRTPEANAGLVRFLVSQIWKTMNVCAVTPALLQLCSCLCFCCDF